jgi:phosphopantetheinyl transferase
VSLAVPAPQAQLAPREHIEHRRLSLADMPYLLDHCFYRQPAGWQDPADLFPVVPMTMHLQRMMEAAAALVPELSPIAIEKIRAFRWCAIEPAIEIEVRCRFDGRDRVEVRMGDYAVGTVVMASHLPVPPAPRQRAIVNPEPAPIDARGLYAERWMFHGPAYQCVTELGPMGADGIEGTLTAGAAPGSLLDNVGQLFGYWVMTHVDRDFLAFPSRIRAIRFYGPQPAPGERVRCSVWIDELTAGEARCDMELRDERGQVWCEIDAWVDHRFDSDDVLWPMLRWPEKRIIAVREAEGVYRAFERWSAMASRELIARRFFDGVERAAYDAKKPRARRSFLLSRIAAKDAVRDFLRERGGGDMFPIEVPIRNDDAGRPYVAAELGRDLRISIAHKDEVAVAMVGEGQAVGVDVEKIEPRGDGFAALAFSDAERGLRDARDRDEWLTRVWSAKESVAKALGTGLEGNPRRFEVLEAAGERLLVKTPDGRRVWADTRRDGDFVIAWTRL